MSIRDLPEKTRILIDTNIFLYSIGEHPEYSKDCDQFFDRVSEGEIVGITSVIVLNELIHKLMIAEIAEKKEMNPADVTRYIKNNKKELANLEAYDILEDIGDNYNLEIVNPTQGDFRRPTKLMKEEFLLSNDTLHLSVMKREDVRSIATDDPDFETINNITIWKPSSIEN